MSSNTPAKPTAGISTRRKFLRWVIIVSSVIALSYWAWQRYTHVYTDDARIAADMIEISSRVSGWVSHFPLGQGDQIKADDTIAIIDKRKIQLQLEELQSNLKSLDTQRERLQAERSMVDKQTRSAANAAQSTLSAEKASLASASSEVELRQNEWQRAQQLREKNILSQQEWEKARNAFRQAEEAFHRQQAETASAEAGLVEAQAGFDRIYILGREIQNLILEKEQLQLRIEQLQVALEDHELRAPIDGVVDKTYVDQGEYVSPGKRLLLMHDPEKIWIDASVKETAIRYLQAGMKAKLVVDAFPDMDLTGTIVLIGESTTSQFSLLPSTNPSGNFTKITQRVPVKIAIDTIDHESTGNTQRDLLLKPGMMVEVQINVR